MALTGVEICQKALILLGADPINSFKEGTDAAKICDNLYPELKQNALSSHPWHFATNKRQLNLTTNTPTSVWDNEFQLPSNLLSGPIAVYPSSDTDRGIQAFSIVGDKLLTNESEIWIDYTIDVNENDFPPWFTQFLKYAIAAEIAEPLTGQTSKSDRMHRKAYGPPEDNMEGGFYGKAKREDSKRQATQVIQDNPLTDVRFT